MVDKQIDFLDSTFWHNVLILSYILFIISLALEFNVNEFRTISLVSASIYAYVNRGLLGGVWSSRVFRLLLLFPIVAFFAWLSGPYGGDGLKTFDWIFCFFIGCIVAQSQPKLSISLLLLIPVVVVLASLVTLLYYHFFDISMVDLYINGDRLRMYNESTNRFGFVSVVGYCVCMGLLIGNVGHKIVNGSLSLAMVALCWMTQSRSAFFSLVIVSVLALYLYIKEKKWSFITIKFLIVVFLIISFAVIFNDDSRIVQTITSGSWDYLLSGRNDIWRAAWEIFLKSPYVGFGVDSFHEALSEHLNIPGNVERFPGIPVPNIFWNAHQIILGILCEMGVVGLLIFVFAIILTVKVGLKNFPEAAVPFFMLIAYIVSGMGGYGFHRSWNSALFFLPLGIINGIHISRSVLNKNSK